MIKEVKTCWVGRLDYNHAYKLQEQLHKSVLSGSQDDVILVLEHNHCFTLGRRGKSEEILWDKTTLEKMGVKVIQTDRGGAVTYHGPGQLVGYFILDLNRFNKDIVTFVRSIEQGIINYLARFSIDAFAIRGKTGVWTKRGKIAAIGLKVTKGVTMHGFALNISTDLTYFSGIIACGLPDAQATSILQLTGNAPTVSQCSFDVIDEIGKAFGFKAVASDLSCVLHYTGISANPVI
jgi:lipoyl(octanoyl) transferase